MIRSLICTLSVVILVNFYGCQGPVGDEIPLHNLELEESGLNQAPVDLRVTRLSGPATLAPGVTWELAVEASDPEGDEVSFAWSTTSGKLSRSQGARTFFTATEPIGRAEIAVEAVDEHGNLVRGSFGVGVPYDLPAGVVMDVRDDVGYYCSLAIDSSDNPHIAFHDYTHPSLLYAKHDGVEWQIETIEGYGLDIGGAAGYNASLALDSNGTPHIAYLVHYAENEELTLNYATTSGGEWDLTTIDFAGDEGHFNVTLKINPSTSKPEILYLSDDHFSVMHAVCSGDCTSAGSWTTSTVYTETGGWSDWSYAFPGGFAIESDGTRHAVIDARYEDDSYEEYAELLYARRSGASWSVVESVIELRGVYAEYENVDAGRMVLDRNDRPLLLAYEGVYHRLGTDDWNLSRVESGPMDNTNSYARYDIACDTDRTPPSSGVVWMASPHGGALEMVKTNSRGYFEYTYVGSISSSSSARASVAIDSQGDGHMCWVDGGALMFQ